MKRLLCLFLSFFIFPAFAVTSQSYVDSAVAPLQDEIPAVNENAVLTNTGTAGNIGTKQIYDSNADYASQQNALVTAETFNAAIQNAIDNEYVCIEWLGDNHDNAHCLLYQIRPAYNVSKNLFRGPYIGGLTMQISYMIGNYRPLVSPYIPYFRYKGPIFVATVTPGETYSWGWQTDAEVIGYSFYNSEEDITDYNSVLSYGTAPTLTRITVPENAHILVISFTNPNTNPITWSDVRLTHGNTAVPYQPYGENTWLPAGK